MADPLTAFFAAVGTEIGGTAGAFLIMNAEALAYVTLIAGSISVSKAQQRRAEAKAREARNASLQDRTEVIRSGTAPSPMVFGRARVGGVLVLAQETGTLKEYLHLVIAHTRHECDAIEAVQFNEDVLPTENATTGFVESGTFVKVDYQSTRASVATNGSGVATLPQAASSILAVSVGSGDNVTTVTFSHTSGSSTVSGLPASTTVDISYNYAVSDNLVRIRKHLGGPGQVADTDLVAEVPGWSSTDVGVSVCYTYVRLKFNHDIFGSIGIPRISAILRGMKVYDPRTATTYWSTNAQLCAAAYVLDQTFGLRCQSSELVYADQVATANICDEEVPVYNLNTASVTNGSPIIAINNTTWMDKVRPGMIFIGPDNVRREIKAVSNLPSIGWRITVASNYGAPTNATASYSIVQKRYEVNGALGSDDTVWSNFEAILAAMAGSGVYVQGRWIIRPGYYPSISMTIDESFLSGGSIQIVPHRGRKDIFNAVRGKYLDRQQSWQKVDYPAVTSSTYEAEDGNERIFTDVDMAMVDNLVQCQRLAKIELIRARQSLTVKLTTNMKGYDLIPGSVVALNIALFGFVNKPFVVLSRDYDFDMEITYFLQETSSATYNWAYNEANDGDQAPDSSLIGPWSPPAAPTGLTLASGSAHLGIASDGTVFAKVLASWDPVTEVFVRFGGRIEIEWRNVLSDAWTNAGPVTADRTSTYIVGPTDYMPIIVRIKAVSNLGRESYWAYSTAHYVVGKSAPPGTPTGLSVSKIPGAIRISWNQNPDVDRAVTEIRRASVNVWSSGVRVDNGGAGSQDVSGTSYDWAWPPNGTYYIMAKHRDTSGNLSTTEASYAVTLVDGEIAILNFGQIGGGNLSYNSSFEADANSDGLSDNWGTNVQGTTGSLISSRPFNLAIHGVYAQQILLTGLAAGSGNKGYIYQTISVPDGVAGSPCILSAYVRTTSGQGNPNGMLQMEFANASSALISSVSSPVYALSTTGLERKSLIASAIPANTRFIIIYIILQDRTAGTGASLMVVDGVQLEFGNVITQYAPKADELLYGQVTTSFLALASATKALAGSTGYFFAGGIGIPFDDVKDGVTLTYINDTGGTLDVQVEMTIEHCYMYDASHMATAYLQLTQTGAVGGGTTSVFSNLLQAASTDTPIQLANPITVVYAFQVANGATFVAKLQARCASSTSTVCQINVDAARLRLTAVKR